MSIAAATLVPPHSLRATGARLQPVSLTIWLKAAAIWLFGIASLLGNDAAPASKVLSHFTSKSGRLNVEVRGLGEDVKEVWIQRASKQGKPTRLFREGAGLGVGAQVSDDDSVIVVLWGGGSAGHHPEIFVRSKIGAYLRQKVEASEMAWRVAKRTQGLPKSADPAHLHCAVLGFRTKPRSVVFELVGNYTAEGQGQSDFGPVYLRYLVDTRKMEIIPEPPEAKAVAE